MVPYKPLAKAAGCANNDGGSVFGYSNCDWLLGFFFSFFHPSQRLAFRHHARLVCLPNDNFRVVLGHVVRCTLQLMLTAISSRWPLKARPCIIGPNALHTRILTKSCVIFLRGDRIEPYTTAFESFSVGKSLFIAFAISHGLL